MNATKSLVTGAVALTAFASVLGLAYAQVENSTESTQTLLNSGDKTSRIVRRTRSRS